jgi:hypothetical protein
MRALQTLVIGMGILIVLGLCLLVFGIYKKATDPTWRLFENTETSGRVATDALTHSFGSIKLDLPEGHDIQEVTSDGERIFLTVSNEDAAYIIILNAESGEEVGRILPR